jgi:DNA-binding Lrp family transcriptional regulator
MYISLSNESNTKFVSTDVATLGEVAGKILKSWYSLSIYKDSYRLNSNFVYSKFVGLDFDGGMTIEQAKEAFKDYNCIIATTRNHQKDKNGVTCDRFRVILELEEPAEKPEDYKATVMELLKLYPAADKACSDPARMFFPSTEIVYIHQKGKKIALLRYVKPEVKVEKVNSLQKGALSKLTNDFIVRGASSGEWNTRLFKAAVDCNEQGYTEQEAISLLRKATADFDGDLDDSDLKTIGSAYGRDPKHPPRTQGSCFNFKKPSEISQGSETVEWLVEDLLIKDGVSIFAGMPKSGKSTIVRQLASSVVKGSDFLDRKVKKGKVLYLALEESGSLINNQFKKIGITDDDDIMVHVGPMNEGNPLDNLKEAIRAYGATLVVVDTLILMVHFENMNDYNEVYRKLSQVRNVARDTNCHIICLHHQNKGEDRGASSIMGSGAVSGAVDNSMVFNTVRGRELYRKVRSYQRGGRDFLNVELKYIPEMDTYELSKNQDPDF